MNDGPRPSPDALLKVARREERGHLKIFLGAAPGVGKTYEMLQQAAAMLRDGRDVVVGVVETHGRADTAALLSPFEILPRRTLLRGAHRLPEFDLDAMLVRRPAVALIDELAHSNVDGSRHPKRWQDVEDLRDAGIDVLATLNIQHIESLNDVIAGFTRVRVRETVPDSILDDADIEVIDLPPDELIERLKDGKVYVPDEAARALGHFFSKSNLSALRELALRHAAQAVDRQMLDHVATTGESGNWAAGERIMVAVGGDPADQSLVRAGKRLADAFRAPWYVVTVETPHRAGGGGKAGQELLSDALNLAVRLGAVLVTVPAPSVPSGLSSYARETRATAIVMGQSRHSWWRRALRGTLAERMAQLTQGVALYVLPHEWSSGGVRSATGAIPVRGVLAGLAMVALTTFANLLIAQRIGNDPVDMIYLVPVIATATIFGLRPALAASLAAAMAYNFFFLQPTYTLTIQSPENVVTFLVLAGVGVVASQLAGRLRLEATVGARTASENAAIAAFGQRLASVSTEQDTARATCEEVAALLGVATLVLGVGEGRVRLISAVPADPQLSPIDQAAAEYALSRGEVTGRESATLNAADWQFHPLKTSLGVLGVLGICSPSGQSPLQPDKRLLFITLLGQAALAHERLRLDGEARQVAILQQRDDLRTTLISSLGHDLKTPLTAVVAAAEALALENPPSAHADLLLAEAHRLRRLFDDLVEMTRIESGGFTLRNEPVDLTEAVAAAVRDLRTELGGHRIDLAVPPSLPLVDADPRMMHHILVNLLDNAAKYAPKGTSIRIEGNRMPSGLTLDILDEGPGIPPGAHAQLFERFHRVEGDDRRGGTGLGLAIVKGFTEAMGLTVSAANRSDHTGSRFTITWPEAMVRRPHRAGHMA